MPAQTIGINGSTELTDGAIDAIARLLVDAALVEANDQELGGVAG